MSSRRGIDAKILMNKAAASDSKEAFTVLARGGFYRIAAGVRISSSGQPRHFTEVVIDLSPDGREVDLSLIEGKLGVLRQLEASGYSLLYQDDLDIVCEAEIPLARLDEEFGKIKSILSSALADSRHKPLKTGRSLRKH